MKFEKELYVNIDFIHIVKYFQNCNLFFLRKHVRLNDEDEVLFSFSFLPRRNRCRKVIRDSQPRDIERQRIKSHSRRLFKEKEEKEFWNFSYGQVLVYLLSDS